MSNNETFQARVLADFRQILNGYNLQLQDLRKRRKRSEEKDNIYRAIMEAKRRYAFLSTESFARITGVSENVISKAQTKLS